jgi:UDP-N-acetylglucosamine acyltransferase
MTLSQIHPTAIVHPEAKIAANVSIGAYSLIGANVSIGKGCVVQSHVVIDGHTEIGENNQFFSFCSIGAPPQDLTYQGDPTRTVIGNNNVFREYVSIHRGTKKENEITQVGSNCMLMAYVHLGHDVALGSHCIIANTVNLAGHVKVGDRVIIGGGTNISQFVKLGRGAYIGGGSGIDRDIPLFCTAYGNRVRLKGINIIGLRRQGHTKQVITEVVDFYRTMEASALSPRSFVENETVMQEWANNELIAEMAQDIKASEIGIAPFVS